MTLLTQEIIRFEPKLGSKMCVTGNKIGKSCGQNLEYSSTKGANWHTSILWRNSCGQNLEYQGGAIRKTLFSANEKRHFYQ